MIVALKILRQFFCFSEMLILFSEMLILIIKIIKLSINTYFFLCLGNIITKISGGK